jgi:GH24 family phage-related lysozyme (muramidase)
MAINPSKLLRLKPIRATITASSLRGLSAPVKPKITASQISSSSVVANKQVLEIQNSLVEIVNILKAQNKFLKDTSEKTRKTEEAKRRADVEENLEKRTGVLSKAAEKILSPVKSLLDKIIDFILAVFIGRALIKLIRWFSDPQNKTKIRSLFRFLGDHWPKLLALYLRFGTGLGRFIGGLSSLLIRGTLRIAQAAAGLAARAGLKGAGKVAGFLGGRYGKALAVGLEVGTTVAGTMALSKGIENFAGLNNIDTKVPKFAGGGLARFKNLFGFFGGGPGHVSGQKGVDKIPAMLSDGEFVMSRGAVQKYGVGTLEAMNAAGGGTNIPKIVNGTAYAAGGGLMSYASDMIKKHESLAALSPGTGGPGKLPDLVMAKSPEYKKLTNDTKIYPYWDNKNTPTIGWGATFYDKLRNGKRPVKMSDPPIKKSKADSMLNLHLSELIPRAKSLLPLWNKMSTAQQGTIVSFLYNAGPNSLTNGEYPKFSNALIRGDMVTASKENGRDGPPPERIREESKLLLTGPKDLTKVEEKPEPKPQPGFLERVITGVRNIFSPTKPKPKPQPKPQPKPRFSGGPAPNTTSRPSTPIVISASTAKSRNASKTSVSPPMNFMPEVVYEVEQPRQKVATGASGNPRVPSFSVSYAGGNAEKNATIYGIG